MARSSADADDVGASDGFFLAYLVSFFAFVGVPGTVLNLFMSYSTEGGSLLEKVHPGAVGLILLGCAAFLPTVRRTERPINPLTIGMVALMAALVFIVLAAFYSGRMGALGYLVDTYLAANIGLIAAAALSRRQREIAMRWALAFIVFNAGMAIVEYGLGERIVSSLQTEAVFRPAALFDHPLTLGIFIAVSLPLLLEIEVSARTRAVMIAICLVGLVLSGARVSTLVGLPVFAIALAIRGIAKVRSGELAGSTLSVIIMVGIAALVIFGILGYSLGLFARFETDIYDRSAEARVIVYQIFDYMSDEEFLFGLDVSRAAILLKSALNLEYVESPIVIFIFQFGLVGTVALAIGLVIFVLGLSVGTPMNAKLALAAFLLSGMSNNLFSQKTSSVMFVSQMIFFSATKARRRTAATAGERIRPDLIPAGAPGPAQWVGALRMPATPLLDRTS